MGIDATRKWAGEGFERRWPDEIVMSGEVRRRVDALWPALGITGRGRVDPVPGGSDRPFRYNRESMRALVVDPNEESRDVLRRAFAAAAEQVRSVDGIEPALRQQDAFAPDVLVVALDPPEGDALAYLE